MECLEGYIGIKGCPGDEPESGLFVNELPGINLKSVVEIADTDQKTYLNVWADVEKRALKRFSTMLAAYFKTKYQIKLLFDRVRVGETLDTTLDAVAAERRGLQLELNPQAAYPRVSPFVTVSFTNLEFYSDGVYNGVNFYIHNGTEQIWNETVNLVQGWNTITKRFQIPATTILETIRVSVDASAVPTPETTIGEIYSDGTACCECCISSCCSGEIKGFVLDTATEEVTTQTNNVHGFRGYVSMECKYDGLVCGSKDLFASALWYLLGEEMMIERIYSDTINQYTTVQLAKAKELRDYYKEMVTEELNHVVDGIDLKRSDCCLECNDLVQEVPTIG